MAKLNVNGAVREFEAEGDTPLLWALREQLGLTGTKYGCGIAACGSCTVHIDGVPTRSCVRPIFTNGANSSPLIRNAPTSSPIALRSDSMLVCSAIFTAVG